ncbi:hypothetical protein [Flavobacterium difficile]|uniref:Uncharacterized protein n=1 Tax=Flavobacterium difficile TaxID=2709659 RepID=A0ABX0I2Y1_9FLAO|nr:hypothetical protein [Flavobacterium difficile]NHM01539.1 hypothetical protein [Flavobacterium difficile]
MQKVTAIALKVTSSQETTRILSQQTKIPVGKFLLDSHPSDAMELIY